MLYPPPYTSIQIAVIIDYLYNIYLNHILDTKLSELSELYVLLFSTEKIKIRIQKLSFVLITLSFTLCIYLPI